MLEDLGVRLHFFFRIENFQVNFGNTEIKCKGLELLIGAIGS